MKARRKTVKAHGSWCEGIDRCCEPVRLRIRRDGCRISGWGLGIWPMDTVRYSNYSAIKSLPCHAALRGHGSGTVRHGVKWLVRICQEWERRMGCVVIQYIVHICRGKFWHCCKSREGSQGAQAWCNKQNAYLLHVHHLGASDSQW